MTTPDRVSDAAAAFARKALRTGALAWLEC